MSEPLEDRLYGTLLRYTSEPTARGILQRARQQHPRGRDRGLYFEMVMFGARLFVDEPQRERLVAELSEICFGRRDVDSTAAYEVLVDDEHSARRARMLVRRLVRQGGGRDLMAVRAATALSELTRNVLMYAGGGKVEVELRRPANVLWIRVVDSGKGIANLREILDGQYRSRTGLGRGILGVRRLADRFDIKTSSTGTTVEFEMNL